MRTVTALDIRRSRQGPIIEHAPPTPYPRIRNLLLAGGAVVFVFIGVLGCWSLLAPLKSAAMAPGVIEVETHRKTVQLWTPYLEGGIVARILVKDGDQVDAQQPLIQLDDTKARTTFVSVQGQLFDGYARRSRLIAERDESNTIKFPDELRTAADRDPEVAKIAGGQQTIFNARRSLLDSKISSIGERIHQSSEEIKGLQSQDEAARKRLALIEEEMRDVRVLLDKGLERKTHLLQLQRDQAEYLGNRGQLASQIARAQQVIAESQVNILTLRNDTANEVATQLRETEEKLGQLEEQRREARDVLDRVVVRAPEAGVVTDLRVHTPGGVVKPGEPLLDLVPRVARMIVTARVRPEDMDLVHAGLPASVRLLPYKQRRTPALSGTVVHVSADRMIDERGQGPGQPYFQAKIEISDEALRKVPEVQLIPGMPAEVMIETGETTVAVYAFAPILDSFDRAFREK